MQPPVLRMTVIWRLLMHECKAKGECSCKMTSREPSYETTLWIGPEDRELR